MNDEKFENRRAKWMLCWGPKDPIGLSANDKNEMPSLVIAGIYRRSRYTTGVCGNES